MQLVTNSNILIVGLGLMGGSYARALHRVGFHVNAIAHKREDIDYAIQDYKHLLSAGLLLFVQVWKTLGFELGYQSLRHFSPIKLRFSQEKVLYRGYYYLHSDHP